MSDELKKYLEEPESYRGGLGADQEKRILPHQILDRKLRDALGAVAGRADRSLASKDKFRASLLKEISSPGPVDEMFFARMRKEESRIPFLSSRPDLRVAAIALLVTGIALSVYFTYQPGSDTGGGNALERENGLALADLQKNDDASAPAHTATAPVASARVGAQKRSGAPPQEKKPGQPAKAVLAASAPEMVADNKDTEVALAEGASEEMPPIAMRRSFQMDTAPSAETSAPSPQSAEAKKESAGVNLAQEKRLLAAYKKAPSSAEKEKARKALIEFYRTTGQQVKMRRMEAIR